MRHPKRLLAIAAILCLIAASFCGCGGDDEDDDAQEVTTSAPATTAQVPDRFRVEITPAAETYEIPRDLGTVRNLDFHSELTEGQKRQLSKVGFVVVPDEAEQMFMLYESYAETEDAANFITVDSMLQAWHVFFDFSLRTLE
ncbi:MAG: DUF3160 domain-containing protein, partial [Armatimonadia bacterium]|nr:DUF3160 domain-containing protein [Armatimonadia bacterium]